MRKIIWLLVLIALIGLSWCAYSYLLGKRSIVVISALQERLSALRKLKTTLDAGLVPQSWDAGAYIPYRPINDALDQLTRLSLKSSNLISGEDVELRVVRFVLGESSAVALADIGVELRLPSRNSSITLQGHAQISFQGVTPGDTKGTRTAHFSVQITDLSPKASISNFKLALTGAASDLLTAPVIEKLNADISKRLVLGVPFPCPMGIALGVSETPTVPAGKAQVSLKIEMPGKELPLPVDFNSVVFARQGVWLLVSSKHLGEASLEQPPLAPTEASLRAAINTLEQDLASNLVNVLQSEHLAMGWTHERAMTKFLSEFAALPVDNRTLSAKAEKCQGNFAEDKWWDRILGDGGYRVGPTEPVSLSITGLIQIPVPKWVANTGLDYTIPVSGKAQGSLRVYVDPLIGGGVATSVGIQGPASTQISGRATFRRDKVDGHEIIYVDPGVTAFPLTAKAETDGKFVVDWGWTKVPKIGLTIGIALPASLIPAFSLVDDLPLVSLPLKKIVNDAGFSFANQNERYLQVRFLPEGAEATHDGFLFKSQLEITLTESAADMVAIDAKRHEIQKALAWQQRETAPAQNKKTSIKLDFAGIEFGPNNDLVAFLYAVGKDLKQIVEILKNAGEQVSPEKVKGWISNPSDSYRRSDIGKTGRKLEKGVNNFLREPAKPIKRIFGQ